MGFANLIAPRLGIEAAFQGSKNSRLAAQLHASPLGESMGTLLSLNQASLGSALSYQWGLRAGNRMKVSLEYEDTHFQSDPSTRLRLQTGGATLSYSL
jgi:hypothetical protein